MKNTLTKMKNPWFITIAVVLGLIIAWYSLNRETKALVQDTAGFAINAERLAHDAKSLAHDTYDVVKDAHNTYESAKHIHDLFKHHVDPSDTNTTN